MLDHRTRTFLIWGLTLAALAALVLVDVWGDSASELATRLETALALLIPATIDATSEQRKRTRALVAPADSADGS